MQWNAIFPMVWFESWPCDLVELGFVMREANANIIIPEKQLKNFLYFDKTCLSLDGSQGNCGRRPEVIVYNAQLLQVGKSTSKICKRPCNACISRSWIQYTVVSLWRHACSPQNNHQTTFQGAAGVIGKSKNSIWHQTICSRYVLGSRVLRLTFAKRKLLL